MLKLFKKKEVEEQTERTNASRIKLHDQTEQAIIKSEYVSVTAQTMIDIINKIVRAAE